MSKEQELQEQFKKGWAEGCAAMARPKVLFTKTDENGKMPYQAYPGDAGYDLYVSKGCIIEPHKFQDVHTGIAVAMPFGIWGRITGRSSTIRKMGLQVQEGVIDCGFRGELYTAIWNHTDKPVSVEAGMRLAQIIFYDVKSFEWMEVKE